MKWYRHKKQKHLGAILLLILTLAALIGAKRVWRCAEPHIAQIAQPQAITLITRSIASSACAPDYEGLVTVSYNDTGGVSLLEVDSAALNRAKSELCSALADELDSQKLKVKIRTGDLIGTPLVLGRGMCVTVKLSGYEACVVDINTDFISAGVNQTLHRIIATVEIECLMLLPRAQKQRVCVTDHIPLSETLIVGNVPDVYRY